MRWDNTPLSAINFTLLSSPPSTIAERDQQQSVKISWFSSVLIKLHKAGNIYNNVKHYWNAIWIVSKGTGGLPRARLAAVQHPFFKIEGRVAVIRRFFKGTNAPLSIIKSLYLMPSPAIFPNAHTAWSCKLGKPLSKRDINFGMAPFSVMHWMWSKPPLAIFVKHQHASNRISEA